MQLGYDLVKTPPLKNEGWGTRADRPGHPSRKWKAKGNPRLQKSGTGHPAAKRRLFDFGDAAGGGIFLELGGVVAGKDAIGIAGGKLNHPRLCGKVGGVIGV
jgi:hypothetical protein